MSVRFNLSPVRLLFLCAAYAVASPLLHHIWFALQGHGHLLAGFMAMFVGDLSGSILVIYAAKLLLLALDGPVPSRRSQSAGKQ